MRKIIIGIFVLLLVFASYGTGLTKDIRNVFSVKETDALIQKIENAILQGQSVNSLKYTSFSEIQTTNEGKKQIQERGFLKLPGKKLLQLKVTFLDKKHLQSAIQFSKLSKERQAWDNYNDLRKMEKATYLPHITPLICMENLLMNAEYNLIEIQEADQYFVIKTFVQLDQIKETITYYVNKSSYLPEKVVVVQERTKTITQEIFLKDYLPCPTIMVPMTVEINAYLGDDPIQTAVVRFDEIKINEFIEEAVFTK